MKTERNSMGKLGKGRRSTVLFEGSEVEVQIDSEQFKDLDDWVRRRFHIPIADTVRYCNEAGEGKNPNTYTCCIGRSCLIPCNAQRSFLVHQSNGL